MFEVCTFVLAILLAQNDTLNPASLPRAALSDRGDTRHVRVHSGDRARRRIKKSPHTLDRPCLSTRSLSLTSPKGGYLEVYKLDIQIESLETAYRHVLACLSRPPSRAATILMAHHPRLPAEICPSLIWNCRSLTISAREAIYCQKVPLGLLGLLEVPSLAILSLSRALQSCLLLRPAPPTYLPQRAVPSRVLLAPTSQEWAAFDSSTRLLIMLPSAVIWMCSCERL